MQTTGQNLTEDTLRKGKGEKKEQLAKYLINIFATCGVEWLSMADNPGTIIVSEKVIQTGRI